MHWNCWNTSTRWTVFCRCNSGGKLKLPYPSTFDKIYCSYCHRPHNRQWIREGEKAVKTFSLLRGGAGSVGENCVWGWSWVPFTVGRLSWLALVSSLDSRYPKFFSGLIHRRIIKPRLQGFPSHFLRGKPWVRFVVGLSLFLRKGIITKAPLALRRKRRVWRLQTIWNFLITNFLLLHFQQPCLFASRDYKGDREGIPHVHPIP